MAKVAQLLLSSLRCGIVAGRVGKDMVAYAVRVGPITCSNSVF